MIKYKLNKTAKWSKMKDKFQLVGTAIPEFSLPNSRGETRNIKDFLGKSVIVILLRGIM